MNPLEEGPCLPGRLRETQRLGGGWKSMATILCFGCNLEALLHPLMLKIKNKKTKNRKKQRRVRLMVSVNSTFTCWDVHITELQSPWHSPGSVMSREPSHRMRSKRESTLRVQRRQPFKGEDTPWTHRGKQPWHRALGEQRWGRTGRKNTLRMLQGRPSSLLSLHLSHHHLSLQSTPTVQLQILLSSRSLTGAFPKSG